MKTHPNTLSGILALALVFAVLAVPAAWAQQRPSSADIEASATLTIPLEISATHPLRFGELVKTSAHINGEVIVTLSERYGDGGTLSSADSVKVVDPQPADHSDGAVTIHGDPSKHVVIDLGPPTLSLEKAGASTDQQRMVMDLSHSLIDYRTAGTPAVAPSGPNTYPMPASGVANIEIGGVLHVKFDNESGLYTGTIPVSLSYL